MKIAILGGHLSPALSIIENIPKDWKIIFIGRKKVFEGEESLSLEYQTITKQGIEFENITTGRLQRKFTKNTILSLIKLPIGLINALQIIIKHKPDIILGFGSYIQLPVIVISSFFRIPVIIHEQTLKAGFSNRVCAIFARKICISWESSRKFFPKNKTFLTGVPLRIEVINSIEKRSVPRDRISQVFVTGGSSGSHFINATLRKILKPLLEKYKIIHQTGDSKAFNDYDELSRLRNGLTDSLKKNYSMKKFLDPKEFTSTLKSSDLIISRGGMNTVYELFVLNKPSIIIPIPFSQKNEQLENASFLKQEGLAEVIEQESATHILLEKTIGKMDKNLENYKRKPQSLSLDASTKIIELIKKCIKEK